MTRPGQALAAPVGAEGLGRETGRRSPATRGRASGWRETGKQCFTKTGGLASERVRLPHSLCLFALWGVRLKNRSNMSLGASKGAVYAESSERAKLRAQVAMVARPHVGRSAERWLAHGVTVVVTRSAPSGGLDEHDALPASCKQVVDSIADVLGLASDRDPRVTWRYAAERGPWGVIVEIVERRVCSACGQVTT